MSLIPESPRFSFSSSRRILRPSFLETRSSPPSSISASISFRRRIDCLTVLKLVNIPPSQRRFTYGMPHRVASRSIASCAARFVPTNKTRPRFAARRPIKLTAS